MFNLPNEIILKISNYLYYDDLFRLMAVNKSTRQSIFNLQNFYLRKFLKTLYFDHTFYSNCLIAYWERLYNFYNILNSFLHTTRFKYKFIYNDFLETNNRVVSKYNNASNYHKGLRLYIMDLRKMEYNSVRKNICSGSGTFEIEPRFKNRVLNNLYNRVFDYYIENECFSISGYPNKMELIVLYNLIDIELINVKNNDAIDNCFNFLKILNDKYYDLKSSYYKRILQLIHAETNFINNSFDKMYQMSSFIVTPYSLRKIFGYKVLDLSKCHLEQCCENCVTDTFEQICHLKLTHFRDDLISHNYSEIRQLFKRQNTMYYNMLYGIETRLLNDRIYFKNPNTNRRIRINGMHYRRLLSNLEEYLHNECNEYNDNEFSLNVEGSNWLLDLNKCMLNNKIHYKLVLAQYVNLLKFIHKQQKTLRRKFFNCYIN